MTDNFSIEDLEKHSGLSTRTLHYYMSKGLLPGPETRGKYASYTQEHLDRLDLILILKEMHLPLDEIKAILDQLTPDEIRHYRDSQEDLLEKLKSTKPGTDEDSKKTKPGSALNYIKSLEEAQSAHETIAESSELFASNRRRSFKIEAPKMQIDRNMAEPKPEIWRRVILADGVELNIRESSDKEVRYKVDRLLSFARSLFKK
jgi:DNA-binding transcriptional MerR regulator